MRILVYGAGAVGGFFGGLLAHAGEDVRFVARGAQLRRCAAAGLTIESRLRGTIVVPSVSVSESAAAGGSVDLVLVCVKTQQLPGILDDLAAAVGEQTVIVPLQNGVEADEQLTAPFSARHRVAGGGVCGRHRRHARQWSAMLQPVRSASVPVVSRDRRSASGRS